MRRLARGYSIHLRNRAALIHRNGDFGIKIRRKAYLFGFLVGYEHFLHECSRRASEEHDRMKNPGRAGAEQSSGHSAQSGQSEQSKRPDQSTRPNSF
jgi:hypothetical protein